MAKTEKTDAEHEDAEAEKNLKPSPKKKPPRTDRENRRIKVRDKDLDSKDKDLSLNYKDIGGSARRVLMRYLKAFSFTPLSELAESGPPGQDDAQDSEVSEELEIDDEDLLELALDSYHLSDEELSEMLSDPKTRPVVRKVLTLRMEPLPPRWNPDEVFEDARIRLKDRHRFRKHMRHWDAATFVKNITFFKERKLNESLTTGREDRSDYLQNLLDMAEEAYEAFKSSQMKPLETLSDALSRLKDPDAPFEDAEDLGDAVRNWRDRLRRTAPEYLQNLSSEIEEAWNQGVNSNSKLYHWLSALRSLIRGSLVMHDDLDPKKIASVLQRGMSRRAQYRGLSGYIPRENLPPAPQWSRPDPREITSEDYSEILLEASRWLNSDFVKPDLLPYDPKMACRIALDYAIYSYREGRYQSRIDAPTYEKLAGVLSRVLLSQDS